MKTPELQKSLKGVCSWMIWKICFVCYLMCTVSPIALFIATLFIVGIERESTPMLSVAMAIALHPAITLPISVLAGTLGDHIAKLLKNNSNSVITRILSRIFTYSLNCHLALIAALTFYLLELWIVFKDSTNINFSNKPFNQCICDEILPQYNVTCTNEETANSFQNKFISVHIKTILITFLVSAIICHVFHSIILTIPPPMTLFQFVLGDTKPDKSHENVHKIRMNQGTKATSCVLGVVYISALIFSPYFTYDSYKGDSK